MGDARERQAEIDRLISSAVRGAREYDRSLARKNNAFRFTSFTVVIVSIYILFELEAFSLMPEIRRRRVKIVPMTRIQAGDVKSVRNFYKTYGKQPVVISGALHTHPFMLENMTFADIKSSCGEALLDSVVYSEASSKWSGLTDEVFYKIGPYIDKYILEGGEGGGEKGREKRYAYTNTLGGLPATCPILQHSCLVPKIGAKPIPGFGSQHDASQPTIFIGPAGTRTELHMDLFLLPFWLSTYIGHKVFRVILFEESIQHFDKTFISSNRYSKDIVNGETGKVKRQTLQIFDPDQTIFPELAKVTIYEGHTYGGDVIYMPPGALHGVLNAEPSFSITPNDLYPPLVESYLEICRQAGFRNGCLRYLKETFPKCPYKGDSPKLWHQYTKCVLYSDILEELKRDYSKDFSDKLLFQLHQFETYEEWCTSSCQSILEISKSLEQNPEYEALSEMEKADQQRFLQVLEYQHGACRRQCDHRL